MIKRHTFCWEDRIIPVRPSIGVASPSSNETSSHALLQAAGAVLYQTKAGSRNRVVVVGG